ncbi:MAG: MlaD family protein [Phycisphaerae bacterium]|nr:MlaD family protein [Phycisphaerae bacterium]
MTENKRNIAIGLTVIVGLAMLAGLIVAFAGLPQMFQTGYEIRIYFAQTHDIDPGDPVYLCGKRVGMVTDVGFTAGDPRKGITIAAKVDSDIPLPGNIQAKVSSRGLAGKGCLALVPDGAPRKDPKTGKPIEFYSTDEIIHLQGQQDEGGMFPKELTDSFVKFGKLADNLNKMIAPEPAPGKPGDLPAGLAGTIKRMNRTLDALYAMTGDEKNQANFKTTLKNFASTSQQADQLMRKLITDAENIDKLLASIQKQVDKINEGKGTAGKLLNDPQLYNNLLSVTEQMEGLIKDFRRLSRKWEKKGVGIKLK